MKKSAGRAVAPALLRKRGYEVRPRSSRGVMAGSRLCGTKNGKEYDFAVKASTERNLSFSRLENGDWRTLSAMDYVIAVVPTDDGVKESEVLAFSARMLIEKFDQAWIALKAAGRSLGPQMPIFIPLDEPSKKSLGHDIGNLKDIALWSEELTRSQVKEMGGVDDFFERIRQELADRVGADVSKVEFEFRIRS